MAALLGWLKGLPAPSPVLSAVFLVVQVQSLHVQLMELEEAREAALAELEVTLTRPTPASLGWNQVCIAGMEPSRPKHCGPRTPTRHLSLMSELFPCIVPCDASGEPSSNPRVKSNPFCQSMWHQKNHENKCAH